MKQIHGEQVKDIITKFFYRENHLCFQILIRAVNGDTIPFREFEDFTEYKNTFSELQQAKAKGSIMRVLDKTFAADQSMTNVA